MGDVWGSLGDLACLWACFLGCFGLFWVGWGLFGALLRALGLDWPSGVGFCYFLDAVLVLFGLGWALRWARDGCRKLTLGAVAGRLTVDPQQCGDYYSN